MILVTGGTGMLGAHLLLALCRENEKVVAIKRSSSNLDLCRRLFEQEGAEGIELYQRIEWREADLLDIPALELAMADISHLYHAAASVSFDPRDREELIQSNVIGTANVVNVALSLEVQKMVYVSSVAALGRTGEASMISETTAWSSGKHNSAYGISKYKAELEVWRAHSEGLKVAIVNPGIILGAGDWNSGSAALMSKVASGFPYFTLGTNGFVGAADVVSAMVQLMSSSISGERFVLVSENLSYKKVFDYMADALEVKRPHKKASAWQSALLWRLEKLRTWLFGGKALLTEETARSANSTYYYENKKIQASLGFSFTPIKKVVQDMAKAYRRDH